MIGTKEKQATTQAAFVFLVPINEQAAYEVGKGALKARACESVMSKKR